MMRRSKVPSGNDEAGLRLGPLKSGPARGTRRLVPWWVRAMQRVQASGIARRQPKISFKGGGRATHRRGAGARAYRRRSVVKASFRRNRGKGSWVRHARYLARERAQRELGRGLGFDADRDDLDIASIVREWERGDELMWSLIISPEDGDRLNLRQHVRDLVAGMEQDLETRLEWVAIDHHNTEDEHVHLLIRGVRDDGRTLTLDRDYVRQGIRELSQEIIQRELGLRLEQEVLLARGRTIDREQWTEIDRALQQRAGLDRVVSYQDFQPYSEGARTRAEQDMARLKYLEQLGLARRVGERSWELSAEHEAELRRRQREHDIIKSRARERQHEHDRGHDHDRDFER